MLVDSPLSLESHTRTISLFPRYLAALTADKRTEIKRSHFAPSVKCRHECRCFHVSALWPFWACGVRPETGPTLAIAGRDREGSSWSCVRHAKMYFPTNCETNDEW